ncbi:MAG: hypothetical protein ABI999_10955, partial [Acidobacteriota bacterium]
TVADVDEDVFAKGHEVAAGRHLAEFVGDDPRASEVVGGGVVGVRLRRDLRRVFRDQFSRRVNKNGRLLIGDFFDAFAFAVVEIGADRLTATIEILDLYLLAGCRSGHMTSSEPSSA